MENNYKPGFSYQEFAVDFTAELFNATQWAHLFKDSGAKWVRDKRKSTKSTQKSKNTMRAFYIQIDFI